MRAFLSNAVAVLALLLVLPGARGQEAGFSIHLDGAVVNVKPLDIREPAVPVIYNGTPVRTGGPKVVDRFNVVEIAEQTPGTSQVPLICSDLISNFYLRSTYQKPDGPSGNLGTSVIGTSAFRTSKGLQFLPATIGAALRTGGRERITCALWGQFPDPAEVLSVRSYPAPLVGRTETRLSVRFRTLGEIRLDPSQVGDTFRLLTVSSMFTDPARFDANVLRYQDEKGGLHVVRLADNTPRDQHLTALDNTVLGNWFELVKEPVSTWFPDSPTIRIEIADRSGVPGRLGLRAYLGDSVRGRRDPNDDSLSVWVEWLDAPPVLAAETALRIDVRIIATPPARVTEPVAASGR